jgi:ankyrin repeat protein
MPRYIKLLVVLIFVIFGGSFSSCKPEQKSPYDQARICIKKTDIVGLDTLVKKYPSLISSRDDYDKSTLLHCVFLRDFNNDEIRRMADIIIAAGGDINSKDDNGMTPAHYAAKFSHTGAETFIYLSGKGADLKLKDAHGKTPVDYLSKSSD